MAERPRTRSASPYEGRYGFSRAIRIGDRVLVAGTAPVWADGSCDPEPGAQARRCLEIIVEALAELGGAAEDVVRTRIFITDPEFADAVGAAHREFFGAAAPAASMLVISALLDPRWVVEIEAEAVLTG